VCTWPDRGESRRYTNLCKSITRCPYCIESHAKKALQAGATKQELAEVIAIAAALNAGASMAHMNFALEAEPDK
jgi:alkylhydroperoxidase/carboxymuconolactone decarboxylase family protein YurZ